MLGCASLSLLDENVLRAITSTPALVWIKVVKARVEVRLAIGYEKDIEHFGWVGTGAVIARPSRRAPR
jgi:hypothetical protein